MLLEVVVLVDDAVVLHGQVLGSQVELGFDELGGFVHHLDPKVVDFVDKASLHYLQLTLELGLDILSLRSA